MRQSISQIAAVLLGALLLWPAPAGSIGPDAGADLRAGVAAVKEELIAALRAADAERLTDCFTEDAEIVEPGRPAVHGRQAIAEYWRYHLKLGAWDKHSVTEDVFGAGDTALETGHSTNYLDGRQVSRSRHMVLYRFEDGRWRFHRVFTNLEP
jgi:uncharacterized protein (TIGR02246 family)